FILFHGKRHPREMGESEVSAFLSHLAVEGKLAASTQNQALSAWLFLYQQMFAVELPWLSKVERAPVSNHVPVVFTREEAAAVLETMGGENALMANLLYGAALRLTEVW